MHLVAKGNLYRRILLRTGKLEEAEAILRDRITDDKVLPDSHREADVLLSLIFMGPAKFAMESASKGIHCLLMHFPLQTQLDPSRNK